MKKGDIELIESGLRILIENRDLLGKVLDELNLSMPNIETPTLGGLFWWDNLVSVSGWRVQRHKIFGNCRILDPEHRRKAWGGESEMIRIFNSIVRS